MNREILLIDFIHSFPEEQTKPTIIQTNIQLMKNGKATNVKGGVI